jgi:hypothetical protein
MVRFILRDYRCLCRCSDITAWRGGRGVAEDGKTLVQNRLQYRTENFGRKNSSLSEVETEPNRESERLGCLQCLRFLTLYLHIARLVSQAPQTFSQL